MKLSEEFFKELTAIIKKRRKELPKESYVSSLFKNGKVKIANKLGEEAVETISAYLNQGNKEILEESADLIFHLMILLEDSELTLYDVEKTLKKRMR